MSFLLTLPVFYFLNFCYFYLQLQHKSLNKLLNFQNLFFFKNVIFFYFCLFTSLYASYIYITTTFFVSWFNNNFVWTNLTHKFFFLLMLSSVFYLLFLNLYFKIKAKVYCIFFIIASALVIFFINFIFLQTNFLVLLLLLEVATVALFFFLLSELNTFYQTKFKKFIFLKFIQLFFFQFWVSFLTSVIIVLLLGNFFLIYGSLTYWYFNYCLCFSTVTQNHCLFYVLLLTFFLKFGLAPAHFLKVTLYSTLSYLLIFIFTYIYMTSFLFFFFQLITTHVPNAISNVFLWFLLLMVSFSFFFAFYTTSIKTLFAFSTILNFMNNLMLLTLCFIIV